VTIEIWAKARAIQATDDLGVKFKPTRTLQTVSASPLTFHRIPHPVSWTSAFENETSIRNSQPLVVLGSHTKDAAAENFSLHEEIKCDFKSFSQISSITIGKHKLGLSGSTQVRMETDFNRINRRLSGWATTVMAAAADCPGRYLNSRTEQGSAVELWSRVGVGCYYRTYPAARGSVERTWRTS